MTSSAVENWATRPWGRTARLALATMGMAMATMVLLLAAVTQTGSWLLIGIGVGLAATSARAARKPSVIALGTVGVNLLAVPLVTILI